MKYGTIYILHTLSQYGLVPSQIFFSVWGICTGTSNTGTVALNRTVNSTVRRICTGTLNTVTVALNSTVKLEEYVQEHIILVL